MPSPEGTFPSAAPVAMTVRWAGLAAFTALVLVGLGGEAAHDAATAVGGSALAVLAGVPLFLARRRWAVALVPVAAAGVVLCDNADPGQVGWFAVVVLAAWCLLVGGTASGLVFWAASLALFGAEWLWAKHDPGWASWGAGVSAAVLAMLAVRHELLLVAQLRAAQADLAQQARADERNRIARELHDVIAHTLTVSLLHVSGARLALEHDPAGAAKALAEAERLGRQSLDEVRATMRLLNEGPAGGVAPPVPGLEDVPRLVAQVRGAGADVKLEMTGDLGRVPATTASTVYRIVQEALTNAAKHAPGAAVHVSVEAVGPVVQVRVDSDGPPGHGQGMGLGNMQQRARAVGGSCTAGPGGRGWLVEAGLPVTGAPSPGGA